ELGLNTLSFIRLGAFALAHAALSHTLVDIAGLIDNPALQLIALAIGHGLIIVLEGLVVFVQTTRLVLFEFFIRFLRADGRLLRPLQAPAQRTR
ncbi:MAG: ATPase, partial [Gammaproteobacteria bacterium]|nr:ATPase [Gammaproteobacteria bacterium]